MENSLFLAKVMGPIFVLLALHVLLYKNHLKKMVDDFMNSPGTLFMSSIMMLVLGMLLVTTHNVWVADWPVIITIIGWGSLLKAAAFLLVPTVMTDITNYVTKHDSLWMVGGVVWLLFGGYVCYAGYFL